MDGKKIQLTDTARGILQELVVSAINATKDTVAIINAAISSSDEQALRLTGTCNQDELDTQLNSLIEYNLELHELLTLFSDPPQPIPEAKF